MSRRYERKWRSQNTKLAKAVLTLSTCDARWREKRRDHSEDAGAWRNMTDKTIILWRPRFEGMKEWKLGTG